MDQLLEDMLPFLERLPDEAFLWFMDCIDPIIC